MIDIYMTVEAASATDEFLRAYANRDGPQALEDLLRDPVNDAFGVPGGDPVSFTVPNRVSNDLKPPFLVDVQFDLNEGPDRPETLIVPIRIDQTRGEVVVNQVALKTLTQAVQGARNTCANLSFETAYAPAPAWCRGEGLGRGFGTRDAALTAIGQGFLDAQHLHGDGVNVVIVDQGLDGNQIAGNFRGGWRVDGRIPGQRQFVRHVTGNDHGMLVARNILSVAPGVRLFDCPLIPSRIEDVEVFLSSAEAVLEWVHLWISFFRLAGIFPGPWVIVNAWAIFDRSTEIPPGHYSEDSLHCFNQLMGRLAKSKIDVVFAAGNCGQFCPDRRCRPYDTGPGQSIYGAHAHSEVLTVGALRTDALWAGSSSQGPGPVDAAAPPQVTTGLSREKPDLCGPSFFADTHDAHRFNGGTSAAAALAAGVVAALRGSSAKAGNLPTNDFFDILRKSAIRSGAQLWDGRLGYGMINAERAFALLP